jgi:hypothetical protein
LAVAVAVAELEHQVLLVVWVEPEAVLVAVLAMQERQL